MRLVVASCFGLLLSLTLGTGVVSAQTGKISGRIVEASTGQALPGVNVVIPGTLQGSTTDVEGYYFILNLKPGTYAVRASFIGFTPMTVEGIRVMIDNTSTADFNLTEETIEGEEIVVVATRPLIDTDLTSTSNSVSAERLNALPVLTFNDVINLQAGVVEGHFRGGRTGEVSYLVDGVPINDVYDQTYSYQVENNAIQEIEVITGTFNAEYGQAQSGIVNIVTKDGGRSFRGSFSAYGGDYASSASDLFAEIGDVSPNGTYELQGSLGGPIIGDRLTFFASGRYWHEDGYLYGRRVVQPITAGPGQGQLVPVDGRLVYVPALGDSSFTSMNWGDQWTGSLKLSARPWLSTRVTVSMLNQEDEGQDYDHLFKYNPDGIPTTYGTSRSVNATMSHFLSTRSFVEVKAAYFTNAVDTYVYEDPLDPRWPEDNAIRSLGGNFAFVRGGARMEHFERKTKTRVLSMDFTSQATRQHQIKTGFEVKGHKIDVDRFDVRNNSTSGFQPAIPEAGTPAHVIISADPVEMGVFLQDKMEFEFMIVNAGLRLDYFDANGNVLEDFGRPQSSSKLASEAKWQVSPRIGLAYPLSDAGVVHISYGHFFQMPPFEFLYTNSDYIYDPEEGVGRAFGFADLEPQQTVAYEIGLQQAFNETLAATFTAYFKDIRNLLGTRLEEIQPGFNEPFPLEKYGRYVNRDYGQVRGFTVAFEKRMSQGFAFDIDYTFQVAEGNASDPRSVLLDEEQGIEPEKQLVPLDWDRRHQFNTSMTIGQPGNWIATLNGRFGSGLPYTPSLADERIGLENSARRTGTVTFDVYATKGLEVSGIPLSLSARIFNLLDAQNETNIFTDTGRAFPNLRFQPGEAQGLNTKQEYLKRPDYYSAPRQVTIGISLTF